MSERRELDSVAEAYLSYLGDVGRKSRLTRADVRCSLARVGRGMAALCPGVPLWKLTLLDYVRWLEVARGEGLRPASLSKMVSHVRGFLNYAWRSGRSDRNVLDGFQMREWTQRAVPRVLDLEEAKRLVDACSKKTAAERRDRMIVLLLYGCGLRTKELCALRVQDVEPQRRELFIREGKGDIERVVPIPSAVHTELLAYLLERRGKRGSLFRTDVHHAPLSSKEASAVVIAAAERAGIAWKVTPKTLRHSYATHLMDRGVDLAVIAALMGHRTPAETGVYLHVLPQRPREAVDRLAREEGDRE